MKRRLLVLSISALLGISLMASCGPAKSDDSSTTLTSDVPTTSQPTSSEVPQSSSETPKPEVILTIAASKTAISLGEDTELTVTLENAEPNADVTVECDSDIVIIHSDGKKTFAYGNKPGEATVTAKCGTKEATVKITVTAPAPLKGAEAVTNITGLFEANIAVEGHTLKSGTYNEKKVSAKNNLVTQDDKTSFEVYSNSKVDITTTKTRTSGESVLKSTYGQHDNLLVIHQLEETDGTSKETYYSKTKEIVNENPTYSQISKADADKYCSLVDLSLTGNLAKAGLINGFYLNNIKGSNLIKKEELVEGVTLSRLTSDTFQLTAEGNTGYTYEAIDLTFTLDGDGLFTNIKFALENYLLDKTGETPKKGALNTTYTVESTLVPGVRRESPAESTKISDLFLTDYTAALVNDSDEAVTTARVGDEISVKVLTKTPATASTKIDPVTIKSVLPADAAEVSSNKTSIYLLKETESLKVTTTTGSGIEKTLTLKVEQGKIESIEVWGVEGDLTVGQEYPLSIDVMPYSLAEAADLSVTITDATNDAEAYLDDYGGWCVKATTVGTATLNITSPLYTDENGELIVVSAALNFVEGSALTPASIVTSMTSNGMWHLMMGGDDTCYYMFTQTPDQEGTGTGYFTISHYGDIATGSFTVYFNEMDQMYEIAIDSLDEESTLKLTEMYFAMDMETGTFTYHDLVLSGTDSAGEEVYIQITNNVPME